MRLGRRAEAAREGSSTIEVREQGLVNGEHCVVGGEYVRVVSLGTIQTESTLIVHDIGAYER